MAMTYSDLADENGLYPFIKEFTESFLSVVAGPGAAADQGLLAITSKHDTLSRSQSSESKIIQTPLVPEPETDLIQKIKEAWSLNMSELAEILGVTRPTLYNWLKGKTSVDPKMRQRLQTLAAAAPHWESQNMPDFLLDYTGPHANAESIRQAMSRPELSTEEFKTLIKHRWGQYQRAHVQSKKILGNPLPIPTAESAPPEGSRKLNERWAENAKALHAARNERR